MYPDARNLIYTLNIVNVIAEGQKAQLFCVLDKKNNEVK